MSTHIILSSASRSLIGRPVACSRLFSTNSAVRQEDLHAALRAGLKIAMKSKDKPAVSVLKVILADITYNVKASADPNGTPSQESMVNAVRKGIEKRAQAAEQYSPESTSPHPENHASLLHEVELLKFYLPTAPSSESLQGTIKEIVDGLQADVKASKGAPGAVMKALWEKLGDGKASVDKKEIGRWVGEALKK